MEHNRDNDILGYILMVVIILFLIMIVCKYYFGF